MQTDIFGVDEWHRYFGDVGLPPKLPGDIRARLEAPCPFWKGKRVGDTHRLMLVPAYLDGEPFRLKKLIERLQTPIDGVPMDCDYYSYIISGDLGEASPQSSYWTLVTKKELPGSKEKSYEKKMRLIQPPYALPNTLEASLAFVMHYVSSDSRVMSLLVQKDRKEGCFRTLCRDQAGANTICVGGSSAGTLCLGRYKGEALHSMGLVLGRTF